MLAAALFLALILTRLSDRSAADIGDGANIYEFKQLCRLAGLARHGIKTPTTTEEGVQAYQKIQELNMMLNPPQWQAMFKKDAQGNEWPQKPPKESEQTTNWAEFWPEWAAAAKAIDNPDTLNKLKKEANLESLSQEQWEGARPSVAALAAKAHETYIKLKEAKAEANNADAKQAAKLIAEAVYGKDQITEATVDAAASFDGSSDDRGNNCKVTANKPGAKTVVATIICLCARTATNFQKNACFYTNTGTADWNGQKSAAQTQWAAISKYCGYTTEQAEPEATITEALNALTSSLYYNGPSAYLGAFHATGCSGSSQDGVCVEYTIDNNKPEAKIEAVAWIPKLRQAASGLRKARAGATNAQTLSVMLQADLKAAQKVAKQVAQSVKPTRTKNEENVKELTKEINAICSQHDNKNKTCPTDKCIYVKEENKCKPKPGSETTVAGAGETPKEGRAAAGCAAHKDKTAFENDKTGDKKNLCIQKEKMVKISQKSRRAVYQFSC